MTDLVEFLRARLDEDEREARAAQDASAGQHGGWYGVAAMEAAGIDRRDATLIASFGPGRVLREVEAKRRIIDEAEHTIRHAGHGYTLAEFILQELAEPYVDHPDYRDEWRPA